MHQRSIRALTEEDDAIIPIANDNNDSLMSCILELYFELYHEERYQNIRLFTYHYVMFYDTALYLCVVSVKL